MSLSIKALTKTVEDNLRIVTLLADYLNHDPRFISAEMVESLAEECNTSREEAFLAFLAIACGLEPSENREDRRLEKEYLMPGVRRLEPSDYANDLYLQTIDFPEKRFGKWELGQRSYLPYEPFVWRDPVLTEELREIPQIGYFDREFPFPAILENGIEWMTVTPNEIETMKEPIRESRGRVLTLGLGLGYYLFHVLRKEEVTSVTVVERDTTVISLFREHLLPQFPFPEKLRILQADAFSYLEEVLPGERFDVIFSDIWHDPSDGLELYLQIKRYEARCPDTRFLYWIEPSLLSLLRRMVAARLCDSESPLPLNGAPLESVLSDKFLRTLALRRSEH